MRVLILACLAALALATEKEELSITTETVERLPSSEDFTAQLNKQKPKKFEHDKQQEKEDELQERKDKIQSLVQPQPFVYSFAEPIPYTVLPQNVLPLAQSAMVLPVRQPEVMQVPNSKEMIFPNCHVMPLLQSLVVPFFQRQIQNLPQLSLPLLQPLMHQIPQPLLQTPRLPTQPLLSLSQPKALPLSQQVIAYRQREMLNQEPLLDPTQVFYPVTEPISSVYNLQQN